MISASVAQLDLSGQTPDGPLDLSQPTVTIQATDSHASEASVLAVIDPGVFTIYRHGNTNVTLDVLLQIGGTASNGVDYAAISNHVAIPVGATSARVIVNPFYDNLPEGTETVVARVLDPICIAIYPPPPECYRVGTPDQAVVYIVDPSEPTNHPPTVNLFTPTNGASFDSPANIFIAAQANDSEGYLTIQYVEFFAGTNSLGIRTNVPTMDPIGPFKLTWTNVPPGDYVLTAHAHDDAGALGISPPIHVTVNGPHTHQPPKVKLTRPLDGQTFPLGSNVPLRAETLDVDGYVGRIEWLADAAKIGEEDRYYITPPPPGQLTVFEFVWTNPPAGRHVITALARDDDGAIGDSQPVAIWVVESNHPPAVVTISAPDAIASEGTNCWRWNNWSNSSSTTFSGTNTALFVIRRSGPTNDALTVHYHIGGTASNGMDYIELPGHATIPAGRHAIEFNLVPRDDSLLEHLETVVLALREPPDLISNVPPYRIGFPSRAAAVIVDNDAPRPITCVLPDRCFHIMKPGANGTWWRIECSTDMIHWMVFSTNTVNDGALHFVDPETEESASRFYRAVPCPAPTD